MHAFLIIGNNIENLNINIEKISNKLGAKIMEFPLIKIDDVRSLNNLLRLSFDKPTLVVSKNIENAGEEALNAFLKNLEEPQENIYFALTSSSEKKILPTIVSRCQVIKVSNSKFEIQNEDNVKQFLEMTTSQKLAFFDKIKDRSEAINFIESLIFFLHNKKNFTNMELLIKTRACLKANGNVNLQLLNLITQNGK